MNLLAGLISAGFFMLICLLIYRAGRTQEKLSAQKKDIDIELQSTIIRDRYLHDGDYAARVQKRFER